MWRFAKGKVKVNVTLAGVGTAELPEVGQPLPPLLHLLVALVVLARLLGEVSEHRGQSPPADVVRLCLRPLIATDGGELPYGLHTTEGSHSLTRDFSPGAAWCRCSWSVSWGTDHQSSPH